MAGEMTRVAIARSDNRRGAVATALQLIADDLRRVVRPDVLLKPNLVSHRRQLPSTHADAFSAAVDALFAAGASRITVAEGASDATAGFDAMGLRREVSGRPVSFLDLNRDEADWDDLELTGVDGSTSSARVSRTIAGSSCRVSLALMKTHVTAGLTMSLKNMLSAVHPSDRVRMHGYKGGNGSTGWKRPIVEFLKGDGALVNGLTRAQGRVRRLVNRLNGKAGDGTGARLTTSDRAFLASVAAMNRNLVALTARVGPHLSLLDGFDAMHREGPRHGTPIRLGVALAGVDPVAVDAVGAAVMGFDPLSIGYLRLAHEAGLGVADLRRIEIVGAPIASVRRPCVPHSNEAVQRHWDQIAIGSAIPAPHLLAKSCREVSR